MEILIAAAALAIAWWQLDLQRKEIQRSGKINALVNMTQMVRERIELHSDIIDSLKNEKRPWKGHADKINKELRPLLSKINQELIKASANYDLSFPEKEILEALSLRETHSTHTTPPQTLISTTDTPIQNLTDTNPR